MNTLFDEVNGVADDIESWQSLIWGSKPAFHEVGTTDGDPAFAGQLTRAVMDRVSTHLIEAETRHHFAQRTAAHIQETADPHLVVMFQLAGRSLFTQPGGEALLRPGDLTFSSSSRPYSWLFPEDFSVYMLIMPQSLLDVPPRAVARLAGQTMSADGPFGSCLMPFIDAVAHEPELLRGMTGPRVAQHLASLVSTRLLAQLDVVTTDRRRPRLVLFQRIADFVAANLSDPALSPSLIAAANHVSLRYVHAIFHEYGTTVTSWIRERRLAQIRQDLLDPLLAHRSIGRIAASWGFIDPASFSRAFRAAFDESPTQCRSRVSHPPIDSRRIPLAPR